MEKLTNLENCLSGTKLYEWDKDIVQVAPDFIYRVEGSEYWKNGYSFLGETYYSSDVPLKLLSTYEKTDLGDGKFRIKTVELIGVPQSFIDSQGLKEYKPIIKQKKKQIKTKKK